ncbi:hypothetical protein ACH4UM_18790 [Streptomyces sp. NPDC020801]|uniref:hypothetical protein n=1 Tax=Streptomyces sp. NPDC020801 TaxID=3365093 RepID=UPI003797DDDC
MTEQIEDEFWAQERARAVAERGRQADPSACGTCKARVEAGGQVEHDECAQRATLLPAPDAPSWELITGMSEEEVWALPARFHVPVFMESSTPKAWVCAVCWGDGWSTIWPCKTALDQGLRVFTADDYAETAAKRQAAELAELRSRAVRYRTAWQRARTRALSAGGAADRYAARAREGQVALQDMLAALLGAQIERNEVQARITELETELVAAKNRYTAGLRRADEQVNAMSEELKRYAEGKERPVLWSVYNEMHKRADTAESRVTELEAERKKYVGKEPTVAEEALEALAEDDPGKLRAELVQVAAVAVAWIEAIDRRTGVEQPAAEPADDFTEARAAFFHIGHTPSLQGLRAELHIEGQPPLVGRYAGAEMGRLPNHDDVLSIRPQLLFRYAAEDGQEEAKARGECRRPFDPADTRFDGHARHAATPFCRCCVDVCHESTDAFHVCAVCR